MAVYGDQLAYFHELFMKFENYSMNPKLVAGLTPREHLSNFTGVLQDLKGGELSVNGETLNVTEVPTLWTKVKLKQNTYVVPQSGDYKGETFKITNSASHRQQGGFCVYTLQLVTGVTDEQKTNTSVKFGTGMYG